MKNILIFPAGTEIAFEIFNALKYSKFVKLYGGTSVDCHARFVFERCIDGFPYVGSEGFIPYLNQVIEENNIDYVYPAHDSVLMFLTEHIAEIQAEIVTSPLKTVQVCRSKKKTFDYFKNYDFVPRYYQESCQIEKYPVFIKPAVGQGSEGARRIETESELKREIEKKEEMIVCEYLPGAEYTIDCFTDRYGRLRTVKMRDRARIRNGISVRSQWIETDQEIIPIAQIINRELVFNGAWFFQVKKDSEGKYKLMEISPRIPGTMGVSRNLGINFPLLTLFNMWGYDVEIIDNHVPIVVDRAFINRYILGINYNKVYVDFDDTLIVNEQVNTMLLSFLYQAVAQGKKIYLLTKHRKDLSDSLRKYRISDYLFDSIIHIAPDKEKSDYIEGNDDIFIDDSFAERKKIKLKYSIPVFDVDMVECLLDWRM